MLPNTLLSLAIQLPPGVRCLPFKYVQPKLNKKMLLKKKSRIRFTKIAKKRVTNNETRFVSTSFMKFIKCWLRASFFKKINCASDQTFIGKAARSRADCNNFREIMIRFSAAPRAFVYRAPTGLDMVESRPIALKLLHRPSIQILAKPGYTVGYVFLYTFFDSWAFISCQMVPIKLSLSV